MRPTSTSATAQHPLLMTNHEILAAILDNLDAFPQWDSLSFSADAQQLGWLQCFLALKIWLHDTDATILSPPYKVDELWHEMVLHTKLYRSFQEYMEITIDHDSNGKSEDAASHMQRQQRYEVTKSLWIKMYGRRSWDLVQEDEEEEELGEVVGREVHDAVAVAVPLTVDSDVMIRLSIKTYAGIMFSVNVLRSSTMEDVKAAIEDEKGIPRDEQRLNFAGMRLEDGRTLSEYNIANESTILLALRLRGC
jgi:hypothetical protein